jgi:macrolide transport system ATP-binding/permease protein
MSFDVIESLQEAITDFRGPVVVITHDRRLIRQFPNKIWKLETGHLKVTEREAQPGAF